MTVAGAFGLMAGVFVILAIVMGVGSENSRRFKTERRLLIGAWALVTLAAASTILGIWLWVAGT